MQWEIYRGNIGVFHFRKLKTLFETAAATKKRKNILLVLKFVFVLNICIKKC